MSRICRGCGGVVGIDCYNPIECEWITYQMMNEPDHQSVLEIERLKKKVNTLIDFIHTQTNDSLKNRNILIDDTPLNYEFIKVQQPADVLKDGELPF